MGCLSVLLNIIWVIMGGAVLSLGWLLAGVLCCITVIGIPIGMQCFKFAGIMFLPFGTKVEYGTLSSGSVVLNVLWVLFCGVELALLAAGCGVLCCLTIIGIPFGIQHFKFALLALAPFGAEIRRGV